MPRRPVNLHFSRTLRYKGRLSVGRRCLGEGHVEKCARVRAFRPHFFVHFSGLSGRELFEPREVHNSRLRRDFVLQSFAVAGHCVNCIKQSSVVAEPKRSQRINMLCADFNSLPANFVFASQASLDLRCQGLTLLATSHNLRVGAGVLQHLVSQVLLLALPTATRTLAGTASAGSLVAGVNSPWACFAMLCARLRSLQAWTKPFPAPEPTRCLSDNSFRCKTGKTSALLSGGEGGKGNAKSPLPELEEER